MAQGAFDLVLLLLFWRYGISVALTMLLLRLPFQAEADDDNIALSAGAAHLLRQWLTASKKCQGWGGGGGGTAVLKQHNQPNCNP
jgi:hypothetical protein